jgi:MFS transporter, SP family, sugar:H+ symporter
MRDVTSTLAKFGSVLTPMYQSETAPKQVRGALVSAYQLFITLGIFTAYCINYGTESEPSRRSWRLPMGIGFIWSAIMAVGILFLRESPRWDYRHGKIDRARTTIAKSYGVPENHRVVIHEINEIREKLELENAGGKKHKYYEIVTGPRMLYRILLGMTLQMLQQLTGAVRYRIFGLFVGMTFLIHKCRIISFTMVPRSFLVPASATATSHR